MSLYFSSGTQKWKEDGKITWNSKRKLFTK